MATADSVKTKLQGLIDTANATTGAEDTDLTSAVGTLCAGFGAGGGDILKSIAEKTITEIDDDTIETVGDYAFYKCNSLTKVRLPNVTSIGTSGFQIKLSTSFGDESLIFEAPNVTSIGKGGIGFKHTYISRLVFPKLTSLSPWQTNYLYCDYLDFHVLGALHANTFLGVGEIKSVILRKTDAICTLGGANQQFDTVSYFYVPSALLADYQAATNWSTYADQFRALEDYTVDGTIMGELDESKI